MIERFKTEEPDDHLSYAGGVSPPTGSTVHPPACTATPPENFMLRDVLLAHGGNKVLGLGIERILPDFDLPTIFIRPLLEFGRLRPGVNIRLRTRGMESCRCHDNAERLVKEGKEPVLAIGFAFTKNDGYWRPHSWCISKKDAIVETTTLRDAYFGVEIPAKTLLNALSKSGSSLGVFDENERSVLAGVTKEGIHRLMDHVDQKINENEKGVYHIRFTDETQMNEFATLLGLPHCELTRKFAGSVMRDPNDPSAADATEVFLGRS